MTHSMPLVSVVIPVYNGADFLAEAIDSALAQTYQPLEVLVVNDGSSDHGATARIAQGYGDRIRYFEKDNGGVATALNLGIAEARGEYISWLSHDDLYFPFKVARQMELVVSAERPLVVYSDWQYVDEQGEKITDSRSVTVIPEHVRMEFLLNPWLKLHGCAMLLPRQAVLAVGGFDPALKTVQDADLWFRLAATVPFCHLPGILISGRMHPGQGSISMDQLHKEERNRLFAQVLQQSQQEAWFDVVAMRPARFYARAAKALAVRKTVEASKMALSLANRAAGNFSDRLIVWESVVVCHALYTVASFRIIRSCKKLLRIFR